MVCEDGKLEFPLQKAFPHPGHLRRIAQLFVPPSFFSPHSFLPSSPWLKATLLIAVLPVMDQERPLHLPQGIPLQTRRARAVNVPPQRLHSEAFSCGLPLSPATVPRIMANFGYLRLALPTMRYFSASAQASGLLRAARLPVPCRLRVVTVNLTFRGSFHSYQTQHRIKSGMESILDHSVPGMAGTC